MVAELYRFQAHLETEGDPSGLFDPAYSTVHVGIIEGGNARNILAKQCRFEWEFRGLPGVDQKLAIRHLEAYVEREVLPKLRRYTAKPTVETEANIEVPALAVAPGSAAEKLAKRLAQSDDVTTASYATEAGQFQTNGIPTIVCGPGSIRQAHQPDEYMKLSEIEAGLAFMRRLSNEFSA